MDCVLRSAPSLKVNRCQGLGHLGIRSQGYKHIKDKVGHDQTGHEPKEADKSSRSAPSLAVLLGHGEKD